MILCLIMILCLTVDGNLYFNFLKEYICCPVYNSTKFIENLQRDAKEAMRLTVGRVLISQLVCESDQDSRQFEIPFLHSVVILFRKMSCVNCLSVDEEVVDKCRCVNTRKFHNQLYKNSAQLSLNYLFL